MIGENDVDSVRHQVPCGRGTCGEIAWREAHPDDTRLSLLMAPCDQTIPQADDLWGGPHEVFSATIRMG